MSLTLVVLHCKDCGIHAWRESEGTKHAQSTKRLRSSRTREEMRNLFGSGKRIQQM